MTNVAAVTAAFSRLMTNLRCQLARDRFIISLRRATSRAQRDDTTARFGVTLTLGTERAAEVAVTHLDDPDTAHAEVAALLRRAADHLDPAIPGGAQGDATDEDQEDTQ